MTCYLCGMRIDTNMVDHRHPLFGTIDHIVPKAMGGRTEKANLLPAHRVCNQIKADRLITRSMYSECRKAIRAVCSCDVLKKMSKMPKNSGKARRAALNELRREAERHVAETMERIGR